MQLLLKEKDAGQRPRPWRRWRSPGRRLIGPLWLITLRINEIQAAMEPLAAQHPPILSVEQAAQLAGLAPSTLRRKVSEGRFKKSVKRGKPMRFWRDRFIQGLFQQK